MMRQKSKKLFTLCLSTILWSSSLFALPEGETVLSGQVSLAKPNDKTLVITAPDKSILSYSRFDIHEGEKVQFVQPGKSSCVLNRIIGKDPSSILGNLEANGKVFLVNPNGIYFGPNATINVGSLIASTLNISDQDFLDNNYRFSLDKDSEKSKIHNCGHIEAPEGAIILLAPKIINDGLLSAKAGKILVASSETVTLDFSQDGLFRFALDGKTFRQEVHSLRRFQQQGTERQQ